MFKTLKREIVHFLLNHVIFNKAKLKNLWAKERVK